MSLITQLNLGGKVAAFWLWHMLIQRAMCLPMGTALLLCVVYLSANEWIICDRELTSCYVPMETRRGFNAMESRGFKYRLRLVVELLPKSSVLNVTDSKTFKEPKVDLRKLREPLNSCLSCQLTKGLLEQAIQAHGPEQKPSEVLTKAFSKSLHECLDGHVPETFILSVDLVCDRKFTDWR